MLLTEGVEGVAGVVEVMVAVAVTVKVTLLMVPRLSVTL